MTHDNTHERRIAKPSVPLIQFGDDGRPRWKKFGVDEWVYEPELEAIWKRGKAMQSYYEANGITIYHGRCEAILTELPDNSIDLIFNDPPYFRVKNEPWDRQWDTAEGFIAWLGSLCVEWRRVLKPNGSIYVCASPDMSARVEIEMRKYFNVLNNIRWVKDQGWHKKADEEALRSYLSPWESLIFAEQWWADDSAEDGAGYYSQCKALHKNAYAPLGRYIQLERERAGLTRNDVEVGLGYISKTDATRGTALCYRWEEGSSLPTKATYIRLRALLNERGQGEYLRREYEDLRRVFIADVNSMDIWNYPTVPPTPGKHPCEKPLSMLEDVIRATTKPGAVVLDCFAGSGTTLRAAKNTGRRAIGIEMSERWCDQSAGRVGQETMFDLFAA